MCNIPYTEEDDLVPIKQTIEFKKWHSKCPPKTQSIINGRLNMLALGHLGDHKRFDGLIELRWKNGTRIYALFWHKIFIVLLIGGNKNGQNRDIKKAKKIKEEYISGIRTISE